MEKKQAESAVGESRVSETCYPGDCAFVPDRDFAKEVIAVGKGAMTLRLLLPVVRIAFANDFMRDTRSALISFTRIEYNDSSRIVRYVEPKAERDQP